MIQIRKTQPEEIDHLMNIFEQGKRIMRKSGNLKQWTGSYPSRDLIKKISKLVTAMSVWTKGRYHRDLYLHSWQRSYLCPHLRRTMVGRRTSLCHHPPPGQYRRQPRCSRRLPGVVLHPNTELAGRHPPRQPHLATHPAKHGFRYCGIIYLLNGDERLAYQKIGDER